jgi:nucleotide-binding universal stress UspA family protein
LTGPRALLCAVADDEQASALVAFARDLAEAGDFRLVVAHIADAHGSVPARAECTGTSAQAAMLPHALPRPSRLARLAGKELLNDLGVSDAQALVVVGNAADEIMHVGRALDAALVVVGTRARGPLRRAFVGTAVSRTLAARADRPIAVIHPEAATRRGGASVLCGVAGPLDDALAVGHVAADLAARLEVPLILAHVFDLPDEVEPKIDVSLRALLDADGWTTLKLIGRVADNLREVVDVRVQLDRGWPSNELTRLADENEAALIVVGCRGRGAVRTLVEGSVSRELCRHARRPVVVVPPRARRRPRRSAA